MNPLDSKWLGFVIYLGLHMHQFQKYHLLRVIFNQWPKLHLGLDALSNQKILKGILTNINSSVFQVGCLSYSNSAVNPVLYAFLSENFKKSFMKACTCANRGEANAALQVWHSFFFLHLHFMSILFLY